MAFKILYGNGRSDKLSYVYEQMNMEMAKHSYQRCFVIVPEQYSLKTQEEVIQSLPNYGTTKIQVYSFQKLTDWVFLKNDVSMRTLLDDTGKTMLLRKLVYDIEDELVLLKGKLHRQGYLEELKSIFSEFEQYRLDTEKIEKVCQKMDPQSLMYLKLKELSLIYRQYEKALSDTYMSSEGKLKLLADYLKENPFFKDSLFIFHGYTGFTPLQYEVLEVLSRQCPDMWFVLTMSKAQKGREYIFQLSQETIGYLKGLANLSQHLVEMIALDKVSPVKELDFLEKNIFSLQKKNRKKFLVKGLPKKCEITGEILVDIKKNRKDKGTSSIFLKVFPDRYEEIRHIAALIKEKVNQKAAGKNPPLRYQEIGVILGDLSGYQPVVEAIFKEYEIPYFFDLGEESQVPPMILNILYALEVLDQNFSYESVFRYASLGIHNLSFEEVDILENYCLSKGISGKKKWSEDFTYFIDKTSEEFKEKINECRRTLIQPLLDLSEYFGRKRLTVSERLVGLYHYMQSVDLYQKSRAKDELIKDKLKVQLVDSKDVYQSICKVMDQMYQLLGSMILKRKEFFEVLSAGLLSIQLKSNPPSKDRVIIGDASRTRLSHIHTLFFGGINDGMVVGLGKEGGFITDKDKHYLEGEGIFLSPRNSKSVGTSKFYMYLTLTMPSHELYLSFPQVDQSGNKLQPDYAIKQISGLFNKLSTWPKTRIWSKKEKLKELVHFLKEAPQKEQTIALVKDFEKDNQTFILKQIYKGLHSRYIDQTLKSSTVEDLYGKKVQSSVSRLEKFAACPYSYFLECGLKLKDREIFELALNDVGSIVHSALEYFGKFALDSQQSWYEISEEQRNLWIKESLSNAYGNNYDYLFSASPRYEYLKYQVERLFRINLDILTRQLSDSDAVPTYLEEKFNYQIHNDGFPIHLRGIIDRVDILTLNNTDYVNVIDYKTGKKNFDLSLLAGGLQLQLPIYMEAMIRALSKENPRKVEMGGLFYYQIKETWLEEGKADFSQFQKEMRLNGIMNDDRAFLGALDHHLSDREGWIESRSSLIVPVTITKKNELHKSSQSVAIPKEKMRKIINLSKRKVEEIVADIRSGYKQVRPYESEGKEVPCSYCAYRSICQYHSGIGGYQSRRIDKVTLDDLV